MSNPPTYDTQRSVPPSSRASHRNPSSRHGPLPRRLRRHAAASGSPPAEPPPAIPGSVIGFIEDPLLPTEPMTGSGMPDVNRDSSHHNVDTVSQYHTAGCGDLSSPFVSDRFEPNGKQSRNTDAQHSDHFIAGSSGLHGTVTQPAARKYQIGNANHLLNFSYVPISRPQPRNLPPRRQHKIKPYNKDLFLQANYKFVVLDTGDHQTEFTDPDRMLQWEDIICVRYSTPSPVQCPICLDTPLCPQITSCGHIFCFPCILRYLLMGEEDKGEYWKKCPLCFMMISLKDLYTIYINNVKQFQAGDRVSFTLLSRAKDSLVPSLKNHQEEDVMPENSVGICDLFSKFILTSDVELSVREAKSDLNNWLCKADSGQVDDLEKLPYVCAALEQLEERMKTWTEHRIFSGNPPTESDDSLSKSKEIENPNKTQSGTSNFCRNADYSKAETSDSTIGTLHTGKKHDSAESSGKMSAESPPNSLSSALHSHGSLKKELPVHYEDCGLQKNSQDRDSYTFYQAFDGQHLILHPLNMKCLLHQYGSYDLLPPRISGIILELETITQSEAMRRRYRYLSHFSLTTTFQLCEIDMSDILPPSSLTPFMDEIKKREKQRKRLARKEQNEKAKAEISAAYVMPIQSEQRHSSYEDARYSLDDFEVLGSGVPATSPLMVSERKLFSSVARLGFAAAHDSPPLRGEDSAEPSSVVATGETSSVQDQRTPATLSFANIISAAKNDESPGAQKLIGSGIGKKGKKQTRVLLSTAGGRRY